MAQTRSETDIIGFIRLCTNSEAMKDYFTPLTQVLSEKVVMTPLHEALGGPNLLWSGCITIVSRGISDQVVLDKAILQTDIYGRNLLHVVFQKQGMFTTQKEKSEKSEYTDLKAFLMEDTINKALLQVEKQEKWTPLTTAVWCGSDDELLDLLNRVSEKAINEAAKLVEENVTNVLHALVRQLRSKHVVDALFGKLNQTTIEFLWPKKDAEDKTLAFRMIEAAFKSNADSTLAAIVSYLDQPQAQELFKALCEYETVNGQSDGLIKFKQTCPQFYQALLPKLSKSTHIEKKDEPKVKATTTKDLEKELSMAPTPAGTPQLHFKYDNNYFSYSPTSSLPAPKPEPEPKPSKSTSTGQSVLPGFVSNLLKGAWSLLPSPATPKKDAETVVQPSNDRTNAP